MHFINFLCTFELRAAPIYHTSIKFIAHSMKNLSFSPAIKLSLTVLVSIFILDLLVPLGVAIGILYIISVVVVLHEHKKTVVFIGGLSSFLTILIPLVTHTPETTWMAYVNRGISLVGIWATVFVVIKYEIQQSIEKQNRQLRQQNEQLEHFAYIASHDLNEPLRTITSFVDIIIEEYEDKLDEDAHEYFDFIKKAAKRMRGLVSGLLKYSRIGKSDIFRPVELNRVIAEIKEDISLSMTEKKATIICEELPVVHGLDTELRQLFQNLFTNALKFSKKKENPIIKVSVKEHKTNWQFCVTDNGIGISPDMQQKIFNIFTKLHLPSEYEGQGIGLAFCKKIVELHQGEIWVESALGQGSQFYFTIPKSLIHEKKT